MEYIIKVSGNKVIFGEMFTISHEMTVSCAESEERAFVLFDKMLRRDSKMSNMDIEIYDVTASDKLGCIEINDLGEITLYLYRVGQYNAEVIQLWPWRENHKLTSAEVYSIIHRRIL